jgi:predicted ArsR family transcriptional regulator
MPWGFLTNHAQALLCIAQDPGVRLREIASTLGITERAAYGVVADLVEAGYVDKTKHGRRNRYRIHEHKPLPETLLRQRTVGQLLALLSHSDDAEGAHSDLRPLRDRARPYPEQGPY